MKWGFLLAVSVSACGGGAAQIPPDSKSGTDLAWTAATPFEIDSDLLEGETGDSVSYPAGDRTDWKRFAITKPGDLTVTLKVKPTTPTADVQMKVLDDHYNVLGTGAGERGKTKKVVVKGTDAGKYYVVVYAPDVKDAGAYTLKVKLKAITPIAVADPSKPKADDVPLPAKIAAVPEADANGPVRKPSGGGKKRPTPTVKPDKPEKPEKPDKPEKPEKPAPATDSVRARINDMRSGGMGTVLILGKGESSNLSVGLKGTIYLKNGKSAGAATIKSVTDGSATAETSMSLDQLTDAQGVSFHVAPKKEGDGGGGAGDDK